MNKKNIQIGIGVWVYDFETKLHHNTQIDGSTLVEFLGSGKELGEVIAKAFEEILLRIREGVLDTRMTRN